MALQPLSSWCTRNDVFIDPRICVCHNESQGIHVVSRDEYIPPNVTLVRIPKTTVLSVKSCSLSERIPFELHGLGAQFGLSFALYSEILRDETSEWAGYLHSLPSVDLPSFWDCDLPEKLSDLVCMANPEFDDPLLWLRGTEVSKRLSERDERGRTLLESIDQYYHKSALPVLQRPDVRCLLQIEPDLTGFRRAFSLVSSRAFLLDVYHGLTMTPVADAFNHRIENHIHIQSDFYVCPECGSLRECGHDDGQHVDSLKSSEEHADHDLYYEMLSNTEIPPREEVFNTYGETLSNAELLVQYGFILDPNDNDMVCFDIAEVSRLFPLSQDSLNVFPQNDNDLRSFTESFIASSLIFVHHPSHMGVAFCIDSEGRISHQLWAFLVKHVCRNMPSVGTSPWLSEAELEEIAASQLVTEVGLQGSIPVEQGNDADFKSAWRSPFVPVLVRVARMVVRLCETKKGTIGNPRYSDEDLGEILDTIPEGNKRMKLAVSVVMGECSIIDSCRFGWLDFADGIDGIIIDSE